MEELDNYRNQINQYDKSLLDILANRMIISKKIGIYKKKNNMNVFCPKREEEIIEKLSNYNDLPDSFVKNIWNIIFDFSKQQQ